MTNTATQQNTTTSQRECCTAPHNASACPQSTVASGLVAVHITVNNHPGVMSHICGLFARRAFNVEGILVTPQDDGATCIVWMVLKNDVRLDQVVKQVAKLHDIQDIRTMPIDNWAFERLSTCMYGLLEDKK